MSIKNKSGSYIKPGIKLTRTLLFNKATISAGERTAELSFSSEEPYKRWWGKEILDHKPKSVRLKRLKDGGALLVNHDSREHVGVIETVQLDGSVGRAVVRFGKGARAEEIFKDVQDGIRKNVSVGYLVHKSVLEETDEDEGTYRITDWEPLEISIVAVPADATVGVGRAHGEEDPIIHDSTIIESERPIEENQAMSKEELEAKNKAEEETKRIVEAARAAETKRMTEITIIGEDHGQMKLAMESIKSGDTVEQFQAKVLEAKKTKPGTIMAGEGLRVEDNYEKDQKRGFKNLGHFCHVVVEASVKNKIDPLLVRAASVFATEESGPDGGYSIPPEFAQGISSLSLGEESLLSRTDNIPLMGNTMSFPKDESTPWGGDGVLANWEGEGNQTTPTKPAIKEDSLKLKKLKVLVAASDELLADSSAMSSHITNKMGEKLNWKVQDAIVNGTGVGMPLGITKAPSLITVAKESSQTADTIVPLNIAKMFARVLAGGGANLAWLINPDAYPQIVTLNLNNNPIWIPAPSGFKGAPDGLLLGRPIIQTDACQTVGDLNDIILGNFNGYRTITKAGGAEFATSMHLWFDQDLMAFKLVFRLDGHVSLSEAITPPNSTNKRSHFASLAAR